MKIHMSLLQLWFRPAQVFSRIQRSTWLLPLMASVIVFLMINVVLVGVIGMSAVLHTARDLDSRAAGLDQRTLILAIFTGVLIKATLGALGIAVGSAVLYAALKITNGIVSFPIIFGICSYVAYAKQVVDLVLLIIVACYKFLKQGYLPNDLGITTNATVFLREAATPRVVYRIAQSLDVLSIGVLLFTIFGLTKTFAKLGVRRAALAVVATWAAWVVLHIATPLNAG